MRLRYALSLATGDLGKAPHIPSLLDYYTRTPQLSSSRGVGREWRWAQRIGRVQRLDAQRVGRMVQAVVDAGDAMTDAVPSRAQRGTR